MEKMTTYKKGWEDALLWVLENIEENPDVKLSHIKYIIEKDLETKSKHEKELPDKLTRVKYAMAMSGDFIQTLMNDYGYKPDEDDSWYGQKVDFINSVAKKHVNSIYMRLNLKGIWPYDDEKDWNIVNPKKDDYVVAKVDDDRIGLRRGYTYKISKVDNKNGIVYVDGGAFGVISFNDYDFVDSFTAPKDDMPVEIKKVVEEKKSQSFFDFNQLKPFDKVLVRYSKHTVWFPALFQSYKPEIKCYPFLIITGTPGGTGYSQCVPYEGNEYLMGTIENAKPFYKFETFH